MSDYYIGLMSGTSLDGIDVALMDFSTDAAKLCATYYVPYEATFRQKLLALCKPGLHLFEHLGELDIMLAQQFAFAVNTLLANEKLAASQIKAIGSHGQTICHYPKHTYPFTMQIGDPSTIAALTGITTISDFRRKDIASGGQGAPLVPAFHHYLLKHSATANCAVVNIGGIANVTIITKDLIFGFDTGPGNLLLDAWISYHQNKSYDQDGKWAESGNVCHPLLQKFLTDAYFNLPSPKSTGREYFNLDWLMQYCNKTDIQSQDVQATLVELTITTILNSIQHYLQSGEIIVCGGGAKNKYLMSRLSAFAPSFEITTTEKYGIHPDWVEASAFAWLAYQTLQKRPSNMPSVTGAKKAVILGGIYYAD